MKFYLPIFLTPKWFLLVLCSNFWLVFTAGKTPSQIPEVKINLTLKSIIKSSLFEPVKFNLFLILVVAWLGVSFGLTWWMRQTALQSTNPDKTAIWCNYQRFFQWLVGGIWLGWLGIFVGFAPDSQPHMYEGFLDWDMVFLFLTGDRLYYIGEQTRFSLQTNQVTAINLGAGFPNWWKFPRVYISWRDETDTAGTLNFSPAEVQFLQQLETKIRPFKQQLQTWWECSTNFFPHLSDDIDLPQEVKQLTTPSTLAVTGTSPHEVQKSINLSGQLISNCVIGIGLGLLLPLPSLSGIYIIFTASLTTIFSLIPLWHYHEVTTLPRYRIIKKI